MSRRLQEDKIDLKTAAPPLLLDSRMLRTLLITCLVSKGVKEFFRAAVLLILMAVKTAAISDIFNIQTRHKKIQRRAPY